MLYVLGLLLVVYFGWRFSGLFRAWRDAGFPADPAAAQSVRFLVGLVLTAALTTFFLMMAPERTAGFVLALFGAAALVIGMQFIRENVYRAQLLAEREARDVAEGSSDLKEDDEPPAGEPSSGVPSG